MKMTEAAQSGKELHETNRYQDAAFPVGMYIVTRERIIPHGRGYLDLHWHEEIQLTLVTNGSLSIQVGGEEYTLEKGHAIFINKNILHITTSLREDGRYVSFNFPDKMLGFFAGSRMEQDDVLPFTGSLAFCSAVFRGGIKWQDDILAALWRMQDFFMGEKQKRIEYRIALEIAEIWYQMLIHMEEELPVPSKGTVRKQERTRCMLTFIHENYMNPIHLNDIAASASVSQGECCRCFQEVVRESPGQYLIDYRLSRAAQWLNATEWPITEIAMNAGFNDSSHFTQSFKKKMGMTPIEYRKQK